MTSLPALEIDLLRTFVLIAESGSFTRTAERIGRSQSAVSLQVQRLESLVGRRLLVRGKGITVQLTPQGRDLLQPARDLLLLNDETVRALGTQQLTDETGAEDSEPSVPQRLRMNAQRRSNPSITVMPFQNVTGDPEQEYFADGLVEDVVVALSRIAWLSVRVGRNGLTDVGEATDIRYILQGSVRKAGRRVRINAQLIEAESGRQLWAEKYDGGVGDVFDFQDLIADRVAGVVEPSLWRAEMERSRRKRPGSMDAYDYYLRALPLVMAQMPSEAKRAISLLDHALKLDPDYAGAHALIAWCHELCFARSGFDEAHKSAALRHADAALAGDASDGTANAIAGFVRTLLATDRDAAISAIDRGLEMNPSSAAVHFLGAQARALAGEQDAAISLASRALWLSPFDPLAFQAHMALGESAVQDDRYEDAAACFGRAARARPNFSSAYIFQGIALALAGHTTQGIPRARRGLELEPGFRSRLFFEHGMTQPMREKFVAGSLLLGLAG